MFLGHHVGLGLRVHAGLGQQQAIHQADRSGISQHVHAWVAGLERVGVTEELERLGVTGHVAGGIAETRFGQDAGARWGGTAASRSKRTDSPPKWAVRDAAFTLLRPQPWQ